MPELTKAELIRACMRWQKCSHSQDDFDRFCLSFLPLSEQLTNWSALNVTDEVYHRIAMLNSPHYKTIIKAWYAKGGNKHG